MNSALRFQLSPLLEGRRKPVVGDGPGPDFNSRPYTRGDIYKLCVMHNVFNFNSRPYTRGDPIISTAMSCGMPISTLATTRGATIYPGSFQGSPQISTLAPTRGATKMEIIILYASLFQLSPLLEGRRRICEHHVPCADFNSRPYTRGDASGK